MQKTEKLVVHQSCWLSFVTFLNLYLHFWSLNFSFLQFSTMVSAFGPPFGFRSCYSHHTVFLLKSYSRTGIILNCQSLICTSHFGQFAFCKTFVSNHQTYSMFSGIPFQPFCVISVSVNYLKDRAKTILFVFIFFVHVIAYPQISFYIIKLNHLDFLFLMYHL